MKKFIFFGVGLLIGAGAGAGVSYIFTKNSCEKRCQEAIDEMKHFYEDGTHKSVKGFEVKEGSDEKTENSEEKDFVRNDKPSITEMSSLYNSSDNNSPRFTDYNISSVNKETDVDKKVESVKNKIKNIIEETKTISVIDNAEYTKKLNSGDYMDRDYTFETDSEEWTDEVTGNTLEVSDLPFDPDIVQWDSLDQCYLLDEGSKSVYMLEKI